MDGDDEGVLGDGLDVGVVPVVLVTDDPALPVVTVTLVVTGVGVETVLDSELARIGVPLTRLPFE